MKKKLLVMAMLVAIGSSGLFSADPFDPSKLSTTRQALYGAMKAGWWIGVLGGTHKDMDDVFWRICNGETNAVAEWINKQ